MLRLLATAALFLTTCSSPAQTPDPDAGEPVTLHAYSNLVQIPVLVLAHTRLRAQPLTPDPFKLSPDSGPLFAPRHVRQEGADAIRLLILLDASPSMVPILQNFGASLADLSPVLTGKDVVSLSILRGNQLTSTEGFTITPATQAHLAAVAKRECDAQVTSPPGATQTTAGPRLWDAINLALARFDKTTSRRVLLLITDGKDGGSKTPLHQLRLNSSSLGITIFALRQKTEAESRHDDYVLHRDSFAFAKAKSEGEDALVTLTEATGGVTLETRGHPLAEGLVRILRLVRERYIVDFVRRRSCPEVCTPSTSNSRREIFSSAGVASAYPFPTPQSPKIPTPFARLPARSRPSGHGAH